MSLCWCGSVDFVPFGAGYGECRGCGTLFLLEKVSPEQLLVHDDENDFYGKKYWLEHQQKDLGSSDIYERARHDLTERNLHWLKVLTKYSLPPEKVMDLGCSHGSFVALLHQVGFDASGVEMSPWVVDFGQKNFASQISLGPVETLGLTDGGFDAIVLMDVLEHLPDPSATMAHCLSLLKPAGLLLIQTPQFKEGMKHESLVESKDAFLSLLLPIEHLFLFSKNSVKELFHRLGAEYITFEPAIFDHYDMFLAVSRQPLSTNVPEKIEKSLLSTPQSRMALAMLDLRARELELIENQGECEIDCASRLEQIEILTEKINESEKDRAARLEQIETLTEKLLESEADRAARLEQIDALTKIVESKPKGASENECPKTVAVDLTPVLPGGHNGGAKVFVVELIQRLASLAPSTQFILLTHADSHDELAFLDTQNVSRQIVVATPLASQPERGLRAFAEKVFRRIPLRYRSRIKRIYTKLLKPKTGINSTSVFHADLLFCPFTAPTYHASDTPTVCTLYDIQYKTYPQFFDPMDVWHRDQTFKDACRHATVIAAISDYSRISALESSDLSPDHIKTIYLRMAQRINDPNDKGADSLLSSLGLQPEKFLIYPANFWKHKNHEMLLTAFSFARTQGMSKSIKLVCTGAPGERMDWLKTVSRQMDLEDSIILPGYLSDEDLSVLLHNSRAMIFPSLYEGFGLPVIEAMTAGIPVGCSNVTSLPEVVSGAALLFDPRIPDQIASTMQILVSDDNVRSKCIKDGYARAAEFSDSDKMAQDYLDIFKEACTNFHQEDALSGVFPDGWASDSLNVSINPATECRAVDIELFAPDWLSHQQVTVQCFIAGEEVSVHTIKRGRTKNINCAVTSNTRIQLKLSPCFVPADNTDASDNRKLSVMVQRCALLLNNGAQKQLYPVGAN